MNMGFSPKRDLRESIVSVMTLFPTFPSLVSDIKIISIVEIASGNRRRHKLEI